MGIRGLQYYIEHHVPYGCKTVEIKKLVEDYKRKFNTNRVIIAVDGMSCIRKLNADLCWVLNGQWKEFVERLGQFVDNFKKLGIELVFFFDGITMKAKRSTWVKRRLKDLKDVNQIFSMYLHNGFQPPDELFQLPSGMGLITRFALKFTFGCNVITTLRECDEEVIDFAFKNKCLAILGQDSDYIICNAAPYLSINDLNSETMTTTLYDRQTLARHIGLRLDQLPLMACLRGNDVVTGEMLSKFHARICPKPNASLFHLLPCLVSFIRKYPGVSDIGNARIVAKDVFGSADKGDFLMEALASYGPFTTEENGNQFNGDELSVLIRDRHVNSDNLSSIFGVWNYAEYCSSCPLEDSGLNLVPSEILYRPVRQRIYFIFKKSAGNKLGAVKEWVIYPRHKLPDPDLVQELPFQLESGGTTSLQELWLGNSENLRWETFLGCFQCTFNRRLLIERAVPLYYVVLCCLLNFMIQNLRIEEWEIDAFVAQGIVLKDCSMSFLRKINIDRFNSRAVHLSTVFMRGVSTSLFVLGTCSYPFPMTEAMPWNFFDGKLFHRFYIRAMNGERFLNQRERIRFPRRMFDKLKSVIVKNTRFEK